MGDVESSRSPRDTDTGVLSVTVTAVGATDSLTLRLGIEPRSAAFGVELTVAK